MTSVGFAVRGLKAAQADFEQFEKELDKSFDKATAVAARAVRNAVRAELRTQGTGIEYPSRRGRAGRRVKADLELKQETLRTRIGKGGNLLSDKALRRVERAVKSRELKLTRIQKRQGGRVEDLHRASEVGQAPAPDVGLLPQGIKSGKVGSEFRVGVGGKWEGWQALHEGEGQRGPRPFLTRGVNRIKDRLAGIFVGVVQKDRRTP